MNILIPYESTVQSLCMHNIHNSTRSMHSHAFSKVRLPAFPMRVGSSLPHFGVRSRVLCSIDVTTRQWTPSRRAPSRRLPNSSLLHIAQAPIYIYQSIKAYHQTNPTSISSSQTQTTNQHHNRHHVPRRRHRFSHRPHQHPLLLLGTASSQIRR